MSVRPLRWVSFEEARAYLRGRRAIVLDSDIEQAGRVFVSLGQAGAHVRLARRFAQVVDLVPALQPHLFMFATRLSEGSCLAELCALKARAFPPMRLVALGGAGGRSERRRYLAAGCDALIAKPIDVHLFAQELVGALAPAPAAIETAAPGS